MKRKYDVRFNSLQSQWDFFVTTSHAVRRRTTEKFILRVMPLSKQFADAGADARVFVVAFQTHLTVPNCLTLLTVFNNVIQYKLA